jgi:hypothetical protein
MKHTADDQASLKKSVEPLNFLTDATNCSRVLRIDIELRDYLKESKYQLFCFLGCRDSAE